MVMAKLLSCLMRSLLHGLNWRPTKRWCEWRGNSTYLGGECGWGFPPLGSVPRHRHGTKLELRLVAGLHEGGGACECAVQGAQCGSRGSVCRCGKGLNLGVEEEGSGALE